ncbi:hypothetical protein C2W62_51050 [Candidatus Entotheonella serta]|nr:hypothetical protein C2W62_51050 [Candidatus Entotheonella serta]
MVNATAQASQYAAAMQQELWQNMERWGTWVSEFMVNPADPPMGQTPKDHKLNNSTRIAFERWNPVVPPW